MLTLSDLPTLNASLNGVAAVLLTAGYFCIRRGWIGAHHRLMLAALATSALFLSSYLVYHYHRLSTPFEGQGALRWVYFAVLISHIVLAATVPPLALLTLSRALRKKFDRHRRIARWTLPIWLYVSVTGVAVYWMLYRL